MSMSLMAKAMSIKVGNPLRKLILIKLADNANDQGECWPSVKYIAEQCEISERSVQNHIQMLVEVGLVRIKERKAGSGLNQSNLYFLNLNNSGANAAPYGESPAPHDAHGAPVDGAGDAPRTSHSFEPVNEPLKTSSKSVSEKRRSTQFPDGFTPSEKHQSLAAELNVKLEAEFSSFCDYHTARGSTFKDWNAALNTWLRNAAKFAAPRQPVSKRVTRASSEIPAGFNQNLPTFQGGNNDGFI